MFTLNHESGQDQTYIDIFIFVLLLAMFLTNFLFYNSVVRHHFYIAVCAIYLLLMGVNIHHDISESEQMKSNIPSLIF